MSGNAISIVGSWNATLKSSDSLSVAILQTDEVMPEYRDRHGDYPGMFAELLKRAAALREQPRALEFESFDVTTGDYPRPDEFHA